MDESWPHDGIASSFYSRHKAAAERALDDLEAAHPGWRVVRLRPRLIFQREAGPEIRRLFGGPLVPSPLLRPELLPVLPTPRMWARRTGSPPGWVDMGLGVPVMDTRRAREELGWTPRHSAVDALLELLAGMRAAAGGPTPPLAARAGGPLRLGEFLSGVGARLRAS